MLLRRALSLCGVRRNSSRQVGGNCPGLDCIERQATRKAGSAAVCLEVQWTGTEMRKCWAACLGDCSEKISGEHLVSAGMFLSAKVRVQGLQWCSSEPKEIGLAALVKNVLCTKHNSSLAPVDQAGIRAFEVFRECVRLFNMRQKMKPRRWSVSRFPVEGMKLERWFLKTLITITANGPAPIGQESDNAGEPAGNLVKIAFGFSQFEPRAGLYFSGEPGENIDSLERVTVIPFFDESNRYVAGGTFYFRGFRFILYFGGGGLRDRVHFVHKDGRVEKRSRPLYHMERINFYVGKHLSHVIKVGW